MNSQMRSSSMILSDSRMRLKPVKISSKSNFADDTKKNMLLRARQMSLDSDALMKNLKNKYEDKEPPPPTILGLGIRKYKGSKSSLLGISTSSFDEEAVDSKSEIAERTRKKSTMNGVKHKVMNEIKEGNEEDVIEAADDSFVDESNSLRELQEKLLDVESESRSLFESLANDNLDINSLENGHDSGTENLHDAAANGDISALKRLISREDFDANKEDNEGLTPIQSACINGQTSIVRLLAKNGSSVQVTDSLGRGLLHSAVIGGYKKMVASLVDAGCKDTSRDQRRGRTALHLATVENELVMIQILLKEISEDPWAADGILSLTDKDGRTPLHLAASSGRVEATKLLLSVGFSVTRKDLYGHTPMHCALGLKHKNRSCRIMLRLLLEAGGDLAIKDEHPTSGEDSRTGGFVGDNDATRMKSSDKFSSETEERRKSNASMLVRRESTDAWVDDQVEQVERMIHMAARIGCGGCLELLIQYGAPVNSRDRRKRTALHLASESCQTEAVNTLLKLGADTEAVDCQGHTPLHSAISANDERIITILIKTSDTSKRDKLGRSYCEYALQSRKIEAFKALVQNAVTDVAEADSSIMHSSASMGCLTTTQLLLEMGWDHNLTNRDGMTPLLTAIGQGHEDIATLLITEGADIHKGDNKGATALHYAVRWGGSDALLRLLVKRGSSHRAKDRLGRTPLHYAASKCSVMSDLYILLGGGADINIADISGLTPLHLAARLGNESLVRILIDKGADPTVQDMYNFTAFHHAKEKKNYSIMSRLEKYAEKYNLGGVKTTDGTEDILDDEEEDLIKKHQKNKYNHRSSVTW